MGPGAIALHLMPLSIRWGPNALVKVVIAPCTLHKLHHVVLLQHDVQAHAQ